jgi:hypothetical protein
MLFHNTKFDNENTMEIEYGKALDQNKRQILNYINTYGYPGEFLVGIKNTKMDYSCKSNLDYNFELNENVSLEYFHNHCLFFESENILKKEISNGNIHPRMYAFYMEWAYSALKNKTDTIGREITIVETGEKVIIYKTHIKLEECNCELKKQDKFYRLYHGDFEPIWKDKKNEEINKFRKEIGICTLEHDMKKKAFETKNRIKLYFGMFGEL